MLNLDELGLKVPEVDKPWLREQILGVDSEEFEYQDNFRLAREGFAEEEANYAEAQRCGCCGYADFRFEGSPSGATYLWGFNYGH